MFGVSYYYLFSGNNCSFGPLLWRSFLLGKTESRKTMHIEVVHHIGFPQCEWNELALFMNLSLDGKAPNLETNHYDRGWNQERFLGHVLPNMIDLKGAQKANVCKSASTIMLVIFNVFSVQKKDTHTLSSDCRCQNFIV